MNQYIQYMLLYLVVASILCIFIFSEMNNRIYDLKQDHEEMKTMIEYSKHINNSFASIETDLRKTKEEKERTLTDLKQSSIKYNKLIEEKKDLISYVNEILDRIKKYKNSAKAHTKVKKDFVTTIIEGDKVRTVVYPPLDVNTNNLPVHLH